MSTIGFLLVAVLSVFVVVVLAWIWAAPAGREDQTGFDLDSPEQPAATAKTKTEAAAVVAKECVVQVAAKI